MNVNARRSELKISDAIEAVVRCRIEPESPHVSSSQSTDVFITHQRIAGEFS